MSMLRLDRSDFIKKEYSEYGLWYHLESPLLGGEHLLEREEFSFESHFIDEVIDDFGVGLKGHPVLVFLLHGK